MNIFTEIDKLFSPNKYNLDGAKAKLADAKAKNKPLLVAKWQKVVADLQARDAALSGNAPPPGTGASGFSQTLQTGLNVANMLVGGPPQQQMAPVAAPKPRETPSFLSQYGIVLLAGGAVVVGAGAFIYLRKSGGLKRNPSRRNPRRRNPHPHESIDLEQLKVGDQVSSSWHGKGEVVEADPRDPKEPVCIQWANGDMSWPMRGSAMCRDLVIVSGRR